MAFQTDNVHVPYKRHQIIHHQKYSIPCRAPKSVFTECFYFVSLVLYSTLGYFTIKCCLNSDVSLLYPGEIVSPISEPGHIINCKSRFSRIEICPVSSSR